MEENDTQNQELSGTIIEPIPSVFDNLTLLFRYSELNGSIYTDKDNNAHLFLGDKELTKGYIAKETFLYTKDFWSYKDYDNYIHLFNNDSELTKNIKTKGILQHPQTQQWLYADEKNKLVLLR